MRSRLGRRTISVIALWLAALLVGPANAAEERSGGVPPRIDELVVTARRREELRQRAPVSVTVLNEAALRAAQVRSLADLQGLVPNLVYYTTLTGQDATPFIRGVGGFPAGFLDQGVGTYVDGVYLSRAAGSVLNVVDFEQVEVLRGPQGTLFGKNTIGGAINVRTIKPRDQLEGLVSLRGGSFGEIDTRATLNVPISVGALEDKLFSRFTFASANYDGHTENILTGGEYPDRAALDFYGALRFLPLDGVTFDLTGTWSRDHTRGLGGRCVPIAASSQINPDTGVPNNPFSGFLPPGYREACERSRPYRFESELDSLADIESYGTWGILDWELGDAGPLADLALRYTGSWREQIPRARNDLDGTGFPVFVYVGVGGPPTGGQSTGINGEPGFQQQIQQELQLTGAALDGRLSFVSGAFFYWDEIDEDVALRFLPGNPILDLAGGTTENINDISRRNWALFGQTSLEVTEWLSLTAGLRYTEERMSLARRVTIPPDLTPLDPVLTDYSNAATFGDWTPMASVALPLPAGWLAATGFLDWSMPYFTYARGFTGGGINGAGRTDNPLESRSFDPELADSFEWGLKTIAFDRRVELDFNYFLLERDDQQVLQLVQDRSACPPNGDPNCVPPTSSLVTNAASSRVHGFELELRAVPTTGLLMTGGVGYTDSEFLDYANAVDSITGETIDRRGQSFAYVPEWTTHAAVQYAWELPEIGGPHWLQGSLTPRIDWSYISAVSFVAPEIAELHQSGYNVVNFLLAYGFNDERSSVAFWVKNLTDTEYFTNTQAWPRLTGTAVRYYEPPRAFGAEILQRF